MQEIIEKVLAGERITFEEGLKLWKRADTLLLGYLADTVRRRLHPEGVVTFVVDRNINYTNICVCGCRFCAFFRPPGHPEGFVLTREEIYEKIEETLKAGGTQILMQGGLNPHLRLSYFEGLFRDIKARYGITLHSLSPVEIDFLSQQEGLSLEEVLRRLKESGLDSLPGGGAEILVDSVRENLSPRKTPASRWLEAMRVAHRLKIRSTATMMFGSIETLEDRLKHLEAIRKLQDETGGFTAFIPWSYQPGNTSLGGQPATAVDYLRTLAMSRIYLDNIPNIQVSWVTQGPKVAQIALSFGANDFGSTMLEENVVRAAGAIHRCSKEEIIRVIKDAGFLPAQRDNLYNVVRYF